MDVIQQGVSQWAPISVAQSGRSNYYGKKWLSPELCIPGI